MEEEEGKGTLENQSCEELKQLKSIIYVSIS